MDRLWRIAQGTPRCDEHHREITDLEKVSTASWTPNLSTESLRAYYRRLSSHLMLQPLLANRLLQDGILGRCLISWPERLACLTATKMSKNQPVKLHQWT